MSDYYSKIIEYNYYIEVIGECWNFCVRIDEDVMFMYMKEDYMRNG